MSEKDKNKGSGKVPGGDYEVGYKKPPKHSQYSEGECGNRNGRPKGSKNLRSLIYEYGERKIKIKTSEGRQEVTCREAAALKFWDQMLKGDPRFMMRYFDLEKELEKEMPDKNGLYRMNELNMLKWMTDQALSDGPIDYSFWVEQGEQWAIDAAAEQNKDSE